MNKFDRNRIEAARKKTSWKKSKRVVLSLVRVARVIEDGIGGGDLVLLIGNTVLTLWRLVFKSGGFGRGREEVVGPGEVVMVMNVSNEMSWYMLRVL